MFWYIAHGHKQQLVQSRNFLFVLAFCCCENNHRPLNLTDIYTNSCQRFQIRHIFFIQSWLQYGDFASLSKSIYSCQDDCDHHIFKTREPFRTKLVSASWGYIRWNEWYLTSPGRLPNGGFECVTSRRLRESILPNTTVSDFSHSVFSCVFFQICTSLIVLS